jgi:hypothetical protein
MENQATINIHDRLARIETKLDQVLAQAKETNGRVTLLEIWKATLMGKIAGIVLVLGIIGGLIVNFIIK